MKILVIGGTGTIGRRLVAALIDADHDVGVMVRSEASKQKLSVDGLSWHDGDVRDRASVVEATRGYDLVFDMAIHPVTHWYKHDPKIYRDMWDINVTGARNVAEACLENGVKTLIYTSTVVTCGPAENRELVTSDTPYNGWTIPLSYYLRTRVLAEFEFLRVASRGLDVRMLCPSGVFDASLEKIHPPTKFIKSLLRQRFMMLFDKAVIAGVTLDDVVLAHVRCITHGYPGCKFLLTAENISVIDFANEVKQVSGRPNHIIRLPIAAMPLMQRLSYLWYYFGTFPIINPYNLNFIHRLGGYDGSATEDALDMKFSDIRPAIRAETLGLMEAGKGAKRRRERSHPTPA